MRLRLIALVLLVIAATAAGFVLTRVDSSRDAWLVFGTGLAAVTGVLALTRDGQRQAMPQFERYFTLAREQAALHRIATLVAEEAPQADVFGAIAEEIAVSYTHLTLPTN